ncbi:MAG: cyclic nucleotide-binding domain-containing protein [Chloroflexota bacterium]
MQELLALVQDAPRRSFDPGDVLLADGQDVASLYVLLDGALRIDKAGTTVATVTERGACVGEMSLLLGSPATADVVATEPTVVGVLDDAPILLDTEPALARALARLLASRVQVMTGYLVDLRQQYGDHTGGLGMIDVVLDSLSRDTGTGRRLASVRDPEPEY